MTQAYACFAHASSVCADERTVRTEVDHSIHAAGMQQPAAVRQLLPAHGVTRAGDRKALATLADRRERADHIVVVRGSMRPSIEVARRTGIRARCVRGASASVKPPCRPTAR